MMIEKITQEKVDEKADEVLKEVGYDIERVIPNQVGRRLGKDKANGAINRAVNDWKERRIEEGVPYFHNAPPGLDEALDEVWEKFRCKIRTIAGKARAEDGETYRTRLDRLIDNNDLLNERIGALEEQLEERDDEIAQLTSECQRLREESARLRSELQVEAARSEASQGAVKLMIERLNQAHSSPASPNPISVDAETQHMEVKRQPSVRDLPDIDPSRWDYVDEDGAS